MANGEIPQSLALSEAAPDSLSELFSRDPEKLSEIDLTRMVETLREQRVKWAASDAAGGSRGKAAPRSAPTLSSPASIEDLGL